MNKLILSTIAVFFLPQFAFACGGNVLDVSYLGMYAAVLLLIIHFSVFVALTGGLEFQKKDILARRYLNAIFHFYVSLPVFLTISFVLTNFAHACIDARSSRQRYVDGLELALGVVWLVSALVSIFFLLRTREKHSQIENRIRYAKMTSISLGLLSLGLALFLFHGLLVVAPTLSDEYPSYLVLESLPLVEIPRDGF